MKSVEGSAGILKLHGSHGVSTGPYFSQQIDDYIDKLHRFMLSNHNSLTQSAAAVQSSARGTCTPHVSLTSLEKLAPPTAILVLVEEEQDDHQNASRGRRRNGAATGGRPARARPLWATFPACFDSQSSSSCTVARSRPMSKDANRWARRLQPASAAPVTRAQRKACDEGRAWRRQMRPRSSPQVTRRLRCP